MISPRIPRGLACGVVLALGAALTPTARAQDPFQPGMRWRVPSPANLPAVPRSAAFSSAGGVVWTASNGPNPGFDLLSGHGLGTMSGLFHDAAPAGATGAMAVAAGEGHEGLFALVQVPSPDATHRATLVSRYSAVAAAQGAPFTPVWSFDSGLRSNGAARLACDEIGARLFVATYDGPTPQVRVDALDAASGTSTAHAFVAANSLQELAIAADGTRAAMACGTSLWIVDETCSVRHQQPIAQATSALSVSGDGARVAFGGSKVTLLVEVVGGYALDAEILGNPGELATRVALSRDGSTVAIGWWNATAAGGVRFETWSVATHARLFEIAQPGVPAGLQNAPEVVRVTADGSRAALGSWGDGTSAPEVWLWDRATNAIVLSVDLPGSVFALDLDASGTRFVVGMKGAHANVFSGTGEFRSYETGERDLALSSPARVGLPLDLSARRTGASAVFFLSGTRSPAPVFIPGVTGSLQLNRVGLSVRRLTADANGRADTSWGIPNDPLLIGTWRHLQAVFRVNGVLGMGTTVIDVPVY